MLDNIGIIVKADEAYTSYARKVGKTTDALTDAEKNAMKYYAWNESNYQSNPATAWVLT